MPIKWLWRPYIPLGKITMLDGDPGEGKSHVALWIAARVSTGDLPNSDITRPANVLILSAEDDAADTLKPRLTAMGADCSRIQCIQAVRSFEDGDKPLLFEEHLALIEDRIKEIRPCLIVIDPLTAYLGRTTDINKANHVLAILTRLAAICATYGCSVLAIRHLNKSESSKAAYRGLGSISFLGAARSALMVVRGPDFLTDEERVLFHYKSNVGPLGIAIGYILGEAGLQWTEEKVGLDISECLAGRDADDSDSAEEARAFLRRILADGSMRSNEVYEQAKAAGIPRNALAGAKKALGIRSVREGGVAAHGYWSWRIPSSPPGGPRDSHTLADESGLPDAPPWLHEERQGCER